MWINLSGLKETAIALQQTTQNNLIDISANYGAVLLLTIFLVLVGYLIYMIMCLFTQAIKNKKEIRAFLDEMTQYYLEGMVEDEQYRKRILGWIFIPALVCSIGTALLGSAMVGCCFGFFLSFAMLVSSYNAIRNKEMSQKG